MSKKRFGSWIKVSLLGAYCNECLDELIMHGVKIWETENIGGIIYFKTRPIYYMFIARNARKNQLLAKVEEKHGPQYHFKHYRRRFAFISGGFIFLLVTVILSGLVWDIHISGNNNVSENQIIEVLNKFGIRSGVPLLSFETNLVELQTELEIPELAWISIEREGSIINVKVSERLNVEKNELPLNIPCNIVSKEDALIVNAEVYSGKFATTVGSGVAKGDIIVSGIFEDGGGNVLYRHANAKIIGEYKRDVEFYMPFTANEKIYTGVTETHNYISFYGWTVPLFCSEDFAISGTLSQESKRLSLLSLDLPLKITSVICKEQTTTTVTRSTEDVKKILENQVQSYEENLLSDIEIVSKNKNYEADENGVTLKIEYTLRSDICSSQRIYVKQ